MNMNKKMMKRPKANKRDLNGASKAPSVEPHEVDILKELDSLEAWSEECSDETELGNFEFNLND